MERERLLELEQKLKYIFNNHRFTKNGFNT